MIKKNYFVYNRIFIIAQLFKTFTISTYYWTPSHTIMSKKFVTNIKYNVIEKQYASESLRFF
jgi:hypothetical protein